MTTWSLSVGFWPLTSNEEDAAEADRRVFYGTAEKGAPHKDALPADTKLTRHVATWTDKKTNEQRTGTFTNADKPAWNPTLLEITAAAIQSGDAPGSGPCTHTSSGSPTTTQTV